MNRAKNVFVHKGILSFFLAVLIASTLISSFSSPVYSAAPASTVGHIEASKDLERTASLSAASAGVLITNDNSWDRLAVNGTGGFAMLNDYKNGEPNTEYGDNQRWEIAPVSGQPDLYTLKNLFSGTYLNYNLSLSATPSDWEIKMETIHLNASHTVTGYLIKNPSTGAYLYQEPVNSDNEFLPAPTLNANTPNNRAFLWDLYDVVITTEKYTKLSIYDEDDNEVTGATLSLPIDSLSVKIFISDASGTLVMPEELLAEDYAFSVISGDEFLSVDLFTGKVVGKAAGTATIMAASTSGAKSYIEVTIAAGDIPDGVSVEKTAVRHADDPYLYDVTIKITADEIKQATEKTDAFLVLDTSASMTLNGSTKLEDSKAAAIEFCNLMLTPELEGRIRVGLLSFATTPKLEHGLVDASGKDSLIDSINAMTATGATNIQAGIRMATTQLTAPYNPDPDSNKVIVMLTDGAPTLSFKALSAESLNSFKASSYYNTWSPPSKSPYLTTFFADDKWPNTSRDTTQDFTNILTSFNSDSSGRLGDRSTYYLPPGEIYTVDGVEVTNNGLPTVSQAYFSAATKDITFYTVGFGVGNDSNGERVMQDVAGVSDGEYFPVSEDSDHVMQDLKDVFIGIALKLLTPIRNGELHDLLLDTAPILDTDTISTHGKTGGIPGPFGTYNFDENTGEIDWSLGDVNFANGELTLTYTVWLNPYLSRIDPYSDSAQLNSNTVHFSYLDINDVQRKIDILPPNGEVHKTSMMNFWKVDIDDTEIYLNSARFVVVDKYGNYLKFDKLNNAKVPQQYMPVGNLYEELLPADFMEQHPYDTEPEYYLDTSYDGYSLVNMPVGTYSFYEVVTPGSYVHSDDVAFTMEIAEATPAEIANPGDLMIIDGFKIILDDKYALFDSDKEILVRNRKTETGKLNIKKLFYDADEQLLTNDPQEFELNLVVEHNNQIIIDETFPLKSTESKEFDIPWGSRYMLSETPGANYTLRTNLPGDEPGEDWALFEEETNSVEIEVDNLQQPSSEVPYTVEYYKDTVGSPGDANHLGSVSGGVVPYGTLITLSNTTVPTLNQLQPAGYGDGVQQGGPNFRITANAANNVIKVLYVALPVANVSYTVEYYKDSVGVPGDANFLNSFTVDNVAVGTMITLDTPTLNQYRPATGYRAGVQQGSVPFEITVNSDENIIRVLYVATSTSAVPYTVEYYKGAVGTSTSANFLGSYTVTNAAVGDKITLSNTTTPTLNRFRPVGYQPGVQQGTVPFVVTAVAANNIIKVLYLEESEEEDIYYTVLYYKDSASGSNSSNYLGSFTVDNATVGARITLSGTTTPTLNKFKPAGYKDGVQQGNVPFVVTADSGSNIIRVLYVKASVSSTPSSNSSSVTTSPPTTDVVTNPPGKSGKPGIPQTSDHLGIFVLIVSVIAMAAVALVTQKHQKRRYRTK